MTLIQAHRGFSFDYPESTMLAYREAFAAGADGLEADVRKTSDGHFVILHDATINRTVSNGLTGNVEDYTLTELKAMDFSYPIKFGNIYTGREDCKIVTLDELLEEFKGEQVHIALQIKIWMKNDILNMVDVVSAKNMLQQCHFFGDVLYINYISNYTNEAFTYNDGIATASTYQTILDNAIANNHKAVSINANATTEDLTVMIKAIKNAGKLVHASYLSSDFASKTKKLSASGVDYILGDNPPLMIQGLNSGGGGFRTDKNIYVFDGQTWTASETLFTYEEGKWKKAQALINVKKY